MTYIKDQTITNTSKTKSYNYEFVLPMFHYKVTSKKSDYLFRDFLHEKIRDFPVQYIILNNMHNLSAKNLYDLIWNMNKLYMNHPNIDTSDFWWNKINSNQNNNENNTKDKDNKDKNNNSKEKKIKYCYPFVLRYLEITEKKDDDLYNMKMIHCPICPWYTYCPGCVIDPNGDLTKITSQFGICVDWCYNFIEEELSTSSFKLTKEIDSQVISENLPIIDKAQNYQSIKDCFNLFFEEENLEDPLYCHHCRGPQNFSKKYSINRLPYVLILSLKRFKYNQNSNFKLRQMITYPLRDLEVGNKQYDLFGVINHYGSINSGHYTAIIKNKENKWTLCNDSSVHEIEEKRVMHSNAYILFYISKESPYSFDYIKMMKSMMNNIVSVNDKKNKKLVVKSDLNYFRYEPVMVKLKMTNNIGYVMEENIKNFSVDEKYDIYNDLRKEDKIRVDNLIKKYGDKKEENDKDKKTKNENKENKEQKNLEKVEDKKDINENKNEKKVEEKEKKEEEKNKENKENKENKNEIVEIKEENTEIKQIKENEEKKINSEVKESTEQNTIKESSESNNNEIKEISEQKPENTITDNTETKPETIEQKTENEIKENTEQKTENETTEKAETIQKNEIIINTEADNKNEIKENISTKPENEGIQEQPKKDENNINKEKEKLPLPDYYNNFIKVKLEFGSAWIQRSKVQKILSLEEKEKDKNKNKK